MKDYKIPNQYTIEETELLLSYQVEVEKLAKKEVEKGKEAEDLLKFFEAIIVQLHVLFRRYQPDMTVENLKAIMTKEEAIATWAFFIKERIEVTNEDDKPEDVKKKVVKKN